MLLLSGCVPPYVTVGGRASYHAPISFPQWRGRIGVQVANCSTVEERKLRTLAWQQHATPQELTAPADVAAEARITSLPLQETDHVDRCQAV